MKQAFDKWMEGHQVEWRKEHASNQDHGWQNGAKHQWILPRKIWEEGLWPEIRPNGKHSLAKYLGDTIHHHPGVNNLKSSWVCGANLFFPFGQTDAGKALLAGFIAYKSGLPISQIDRLELEYESEDLACKPSSLLGELGGAREKGQTSPDIAFIDERDKVLVLTENKLVEHSFYNCSARATKRSARDDRPPNPDPSRCLRLSTVMANPECVCHQAAWGRRYWNILRPLTNAPNVTAACPAAFGGYQLFRQQALAEGIANLKSDWRVISSVALDNRNETLHNCMRKQGILDLQSDWGCLFRGKVKFIVFTHQEWVKWVRAHDTTGVWKTWYDWVTERYAF